MTMTDLCAELKNYFCLAKYFDVFTISAGNLLLYSELLTEGQYFRIVGSAKNDGVYQYPTSDLKDEVFEGAVWAMAIPPSVIALQADISEWEDKNASIVDSPYQSESFGGYSYSTKSGTGASSAYTWRDHFAARLKPWRKIRV